MAKLYSFYWRNETIIFFVDSGTTWWPSSKILKKLGISSSPNAIFKKCNISSSEQKRFSEFDCSLVFFPKASYFLSALAVSQLLESALVDPTTPEVQHVQEWLNTESLNLQEVTTTISLHTQRIQKQDQRADQYQRSQLVLELLRLTESLTFDIDMQRPTTSGTKEQGLKVTKLLGAYFRKSNKFFKT